MICENCSPAKNYDDSLSPKNSYGEGSYHISSDLKLIDSLSNSLCNLTGIDKNKLYDFISKNNIDDIFKGDNAFSKDENKKLSEIYEMLCFVRAKGDELL